MCVVGTLILQAHVVKCNAHSFTCVLHVVIVTIPGTIGFIDQFVSHFIWLCLSFYRPICAYAFCTGFCSGLHDEPACDTYVHAHSRRNEHAPCGKWQLRGSVYISTAHTCTHHRTLSDWLCTVTTKFRLIGKPQYHTLIRFVHKSCMQ